MKNTPDFCTILCFLLKNEQKNCTKGVWEHLSMLQNFFSNTIQRFSSFILKIIHQKFSEGAKKWETPFLQLVLNTHVNELNFLLCGRRRM